MKRKSCYIITIVGLFLFLIPGCKDKKQDTPETEQARIEQKDEKTEVRIEKARLDCFEMELVSNGKVEAKEKATLNFIVSDIIDSIYVKNGSRVRKGDAIALINGQKSAEQLREAQLNLEKMKLELRNRLMSEGVNELKDSANIPRQRLSTIMLQTGYTSAVNSYEKAKTDYANIRIYAPFGGMIADMEAKPFNPSSAYKSLCTLINDSQMEVVFNVLETEIGYIHQDMDVELTPYANNKITLYGKVTEVNPRIDENGMIKIKATISNPEHTLVDGMNVSITLKRRIGDKLIVPKTAVLPRQGKKVIFVHQNGKAIWKYITTSAENRKEICIESGLQEGEEVVYENNLGLSHESEITVREDKKNKD